jgi:hypothetical protein
MTIRIPRIALLVALTTLITSGAAVGAYFAGQSSEHLSTHERERYAAGLQAGREQGESAGTERWFAEGEAAGLKRGKELGRTEGQAKGAAAGQAEAFEGYSGGWEVGSWYAIKIGTGQESGLQGKYSIPTRVGPLRERRAYSLCEGGICGEDLPAG